MNRAAFFAHLRKRNSGIFGTSLSQGQVDGCNAILAACAGYPVSHVAYCLATAYHEVGGTMQPVRETFAKTDDTAISRLEGAWKRGKLPWVKSPYWRRDASGKSWLGRGLVQLTWKRNYEKAAALTGVDLVGNPNLAMRLDVAAKVLAEGSRVGMFTGQKLADYLPSDYYSARAIINGDRSKRNSKGQRMGDMIAGYAKAFEAALKAAGYTQKTAHHSAQPASGGQSPFAALIAALAAFFGGKK